MMTLALTEMQAQAIEGGHGTRRSPLECRNSDDQYLKVRSTP